MILPGSEIRTAHALNYVAIRVTVDYFTPHEVTYLLVGQPICHKGRASSFINKCNQIKSFLSDHNLLWQYTFLNFCVQMLCSLKHKGTSLYKFRFIKNIMLLWHTKLPFGRKQSCTCNFFSYQPCYDETPVYLVRWATWAAVHRGQLQFSLTWPVFFKILTIDIPWLAREGELWGVCCE